jgi:hypothetical protein
MGDGLQSDAAALRLGLGLSGVGAHEGTLVSEVRPGHPIYCCANRIGAVKMEWAPIKVREKWIFSFFLLPFSGIFLYMDLKCLIHFSWDLLLSLVFSGFRVASKITVNILLFDR